MIRQLKSSIEHLYHGMLAKHQAKMEAQNDTRVLRHLMDVSSRLSSQEKRAIHARWGKIVDSIPDGYHFYQGMKTIHGFDSRFLPSGYFFPKLLAILNPDRWKTILCHKSMLEMIGHSGIRHPYTVLRSYGGVLLDHEFHPVSAKKAADLIKSQNQPLIFKQAFDSSQGQGVKLIPLSGFDDLVSQIISGRIFKGMTDFVIQQPVKQSGDTRLFNQSSLNCMRITTLNINGTVSVGSRALKCGPLNSIVDNIGSGRRGVIVGIRPDGTLEENGFFGNGESTNQHNGNLFQGKKITGFHKVIDAAITCHRLIPTCGIIGWDIALDDSDNPVLIEGNTTYPGILMEQMCSGPIFGERTDEIIAYLSKKIKQ